jgi:DNA-directed RNA polymerase subunit M/transcription elongation factor TFIIS
MSDITPTETPTGALAARLDGCPQACGNAEVPFGQFTTSTGVVGLYVCADCGHRWHTSWAAEVA